MKYSPRLLRGDREEIELHGLSSSSKCRNLFLGGVSNSSVSLEHGNFRGETLY